MNMKKLVLFLSFFLFTVATFANGIKIANVSLTGQNTTNQTTKVKFDVSWNNSWRVSAGPANWDAAWLFVKFRVGNGNWQHAFLSNTGHTAPSGSNIAVGLLTPGTTFNATTNPGMGVFINRSVDGNGTFSVTGVELLWNYGAQGIANNAAVDVQVYGVEMVYVPQAPFWAGDGATIAQNRSFRQGSADNDPWYIASESAISVLNAAGSGSGTNMTSVSDYYYLSQAATASTGEYATGAVYAIPANFPKGFEAMYVMKYEISQNQYLEFFNSLTQDQKLRRDISLNQTGGPTGSKQTDAQTYRNSFSWPGNGAATFATTASFGTFTDEACNFLTYADVAAYLDWASLRPMTELEFEKSSRGTSPVVSQEYAWGTTNIAAIGAANRYVLADEGLPTETITSNYATNAGNANWYNTWTNTNSGGPFRVGVFATANSNRETAGAGYWGIMELSGNVWELCYSVGRTDNLTYTGAHGNGALDGNGDQDVVGWPAITVPVGLRGGSWSSSVTAGVVNELRTSDRSSSSTTGIRARANDTGGRGVRTAK
jgi:hypothetical protein